MARILPLPVRSPSIQTKGRILSRTSQMGHQGKGLKYHAHVFAPKFDQFIAFILVTSSSIDQDLLPLSAR